MCHLSPPGHLEAQTAIGLLLRHGHGASRDDRTALAWFSSAARAGHVHAM